MDLKVGIFEFSWWRKALGASKGKIGNYMIGVYIVPTVKDRIQVWPDI